MNTDLSIWIYFNLFLLIMLAVDLGVFNRKVKTISFRQSILWTVLWILLALIFNYLIYEFQGPDKALDFITGYVIEKTLSIDNIFVIVLIFQYFAIPDKYQHKVLFWGVLGALVMRLIFIFLGVELIAHLHWIIYVFGAILIYTGIKMAFDNGHKKDLDNNLLVRFIKKIIPVHSTTVTDKFFIVVNAKRYATPLFLCLLVVEASDLIFAVDSIPAILAITTDEFIIYSSNAFAILGLRSLYFSMAGLVKIFTYLNYGLAFILTFVGIKMVIADVYPISTSVSLIIILSAISLSILFSLLLKNSTKNNNELV